MVLSQQTSSISTMNREGISTIGGKKGGSMSISNLTGCDNKFGFDSKDDRKS